MIEEARGLALRRGQWKYIAPKGGSHKKKSPKGKAPKAQLYNLKNDLGEQKNVIDQYPEIQKEMAELLNKLVTQGWVRE